MQPLVSVIIFCFILPDSAGGYYCLGRTEKEALVVKYIPAVEGIATGNFSVMPANLPEPVGYNLWNWLLMVIVTGSGILLIKSGIQYCSFLRIRRRAHLISDQEIKIYEMDGDITPFSFGRSIF